jgi:elongation factor P
LLSKDIRLTGCRIVVEMEQLCWRLQAPTAVVNIATNSRNKYPVDIIMPTAPKPKILPYFCSLKFYTMATTADMRSGLIIKVDGSLYSVIEFGQNKTARSAAKVWAKLKGVDNTRNIELTWNSGETIYPVRVEKKTYQYLYKDDTGYSFMDTETFEQITVPENMVDAPRFLKDGQEVTVSINGETELPMAVELPDKIVLLVTYSEPGMRGDTATKTLKPATVETGATVNVPLFVNEGELIRVNAKTGEYVERVKE